MQASRLFMEIGISMQILNDGLQFARGEPNEFVSALMACYGQYG